MQRPDIEVLEAVALILRVRVDDLLDVRAMAPAEAVSVVSDDVLLDAERDARLRDLAELRDRGDRPLTEADVCESEMLNVAPTTRHNSKLPPVSCYTSYSMSRTTVKE